MRKIGLLFLVALLSFSIFSSCSSGESSELTPDVNQISNFSFVKGDSYIFQKSDGVSVNLISKIYFNQEEGWKREVIFKDLPFIVYNMAVDSKNNQLYLVGSDKTIYRITPVAGSKPVPVMTIPNYNPSNTRITINNTQSILYITSPTSSTIDQKSIADNSPLPTIFIPNGEKGMDLDYDNVNKSFYFITAQGSIYCIPFNKSSFKVLQPGSTSDNLLIYPGGTFPGNGLYFNILANTYICDKNNGSGLKEIATNFNYDSCIILNVEKNLLLYFRTGSTTMYTVDVITSTITTTNLNVGGIVSCGVGIN